MGCGGSKEDVAAGNTAANSSNRLFRRKSTLSAGHQSSLTSDDTSVAVKDVIKETAPGEGKADGEVASPEKPFAVVVEEEKKEVVVVKKDVTDAVAATTVTEGAELVVSKKNVADDIAAAATVAEEPPKKEEEELPKSTMADEAVVAPMEEAKVHDAKEAGAPKVKEKKVDEAMAPPPNSGTL